MRVQSIWTPIEPGNPAGDGFLCAAGEVSFRKVHRIAEAHHFAQKIRSMAEALENTGHLLTAGVCAPFVVHRRNLAGCVRVFNHVDFRLRMVGHGLRQTSTTPPRD